MSLISKTDCQHNWVIHYSGGSDHVGAKVCYSCGAAKWPVIIHDIDEYREKIRKEVITELAQSLGIKL